MQALSENILSCFTLPLPDLKKAFMTLMWFARGMVVPLEDSHIGILMNSVLILHQMWSP